MTGARCVFIAPLLLLGGESVSCEGNSWTQHLDITNGTGGGPNSVEVRLEHGGKTLIETVKNANGSQTIRRYQRLE